MFRLNNVLVEDKKLAPVLKGLAGNILSMDPPQPVIIDGDGSPKSGREVFESLPKEFTREAMDRGMVQAGLSTKSSNSYLQTAKKQGLAKLVRRGHWRKLK